MPLTFREVAEILKLIDASECDEVVLELEGARLVVRRNTGGKATANFTPSPGAAPVTLGADEPAGDAPVAAASPAPQAPSAPLLKEPVAVAEAGATDIRAPMVGTFYRRPSPDEAPFVEEGAHVKKGDPLCLIEVMKLFTTIEAPADGIVTAIAAEDGTLVEFNQLLMQVRA